MFNRRKTPAAGIEFSVPRMVCEGCADTIRTALIAIQGVERVMPNAWQKRVRVRFDPAVVDGVELQKALSKIGYDATEAEA